MNAIPTKINGLQFRSRLEATWACFFDQLKWQWEYEPFDLNGYIPDFVLKFNKPIIVEVKPFVSLYDGMQFCDKLQNSGWDGEILLVGASLFDNFGCLGWLFESFMGDGDDWGKAMLHFCDHCNRVSFHHDDYWWGCRVCRKYEGNQDLGEIKPEAVRVLWNKAKNESQWKPFKT